MKVKYNVKGVETGAGDFIAAKPGLYLCKIVEATTEKPKDKDQRIHVQLDIVADAKGSKKEVKKQLGKGQAFSRLHDYVNLESEAAAFKLRQYLEATGKVQEDKPKSEAGTVDPDKEWPGQLVLVRVKNEPYNGEATAKPGNVMPPPEAEAEEDEEEDEDEDEEGEDAETDEDEDEDEDEEDEGEDEDEDDDAWTEEELKELSTADLREVAFGEDGYGFNKSAYMKKGKGGKKVLDKAKVIADILEADAKADGDEGEDDDEDTTDYSSWDVEALKKELKEREIKAPKGKAKMVAALEKDDEEDPF